MSADEQGYNGWKNYPTWAAVHLWIDNDQGMQDWWLAESVDALENAEHPRLEIAHALQNHIRETIESDDASMASDLLGYALDCVDWNEIADAYLEMAREQVAA